MNSNWNCSRCTFTNWYQLSECEVCEEGRPCFSSSSYLSVNKKPNPVPVDSEVISALEDVIPQKRPRGQIIIDLSGPDADEEDDEDDADSDEEEKREEEKKVLEEDLIEFAHQGGLSNHLKLEPHQVNGLRVFFGVQINRVISSSHVVFIWEMGSGKTMLTLALTCLAKATISLVAQHEESSESTDQRVSRNEPKARCSIIVVPTTTIDLVWRAHFGRHTNLSVHYIRSQQARPAVIDRDVLVITFGQLKSIFDDAYERAPNGRWRRNAHPSPVFDYQFDIVAIDEVHNARNRGTKLSDALRHLSVNARKVAGLTGTPGFFSIFFVVFFNTTTASSK